MELNTVLEGDRLIDGLYKGFAYVGVVVGFIMDLHHSLSDPNLTTSQKAAATCLLVGIAILGGVAVYLAGTTFAAFLAGIGILLALNFIREKIMEYIINSSVIEYDVRLT